MALHSLQNANRPEPLKRLQVLVELTQARNGSGSRRLLI